MNNEMTTSQYFCISFDPSLVGMSIECRDDETGSSNYIDFASISEKYLFPYVISKDGYLWIAPAVRYAEGGLKKLTSGYIKLEITAKTRSVEDAQIKFGISENCRTIENAEVLRQDIIVLRIDGERVSIQYRLKDAPKPKLEKVAASVEANEADLLRDIYADLEILRHYKAHDANGSVESALKAAAAAIESGQGCPTENIYVAEAALADMISAQAEVLHRYKTQIADGSR